jgi:hypothetical protein
MITLSSPVFTVREGAVHDLLIQLPYMHLFLQFCVTLGEPRQADENLWWLIELTVFMQAHMF